MNTNDTSQLPTRLTKKQRRELRKQEKQQELNRRTKKENAKRALKWLLLLATLVAVVAIIVKTSAPQNSSDSQSTHIQNDILPSDHVKGNPSSTTTLIEYSDLQCPACARYFPLVKQLVAKQGDRVRFAYRHFPLPQHTNAKRAAYAAEAAGMQGKFWEMHDVLFEKQNEWAGLNAKKAEETFVQYAETLNLDTEQFQKDSESGAVKDKVNDDYNSGVRAKVDATPTFYLNGKKITAPQNLDEFESLIKTTE